MKKILFTAAAFLSLSLNTFAQGPPWQPSGQNIVHTSRAVGINTSTPAYTLDVDGIIRSSILSGGTGIVSYNNDGVLQQLPFTQSVQDVLRGDGTWGSYADSDWKVVGNNMYSIPSGNVGIGTINPQAKLDVLGTAIITENLKVGTGTVFIGTDRFGVSNNLCTTNGPLFIQNGALCDEDIVMSAFSNSGNVGIGVFNPAEKLHVVGNLKVSDTLIAGGLDVGYTSFDSLIVLDQIKVRTNSIFIGGNGPTFPIGGLDNNIYTTNGPLTMQNGSIEHTYINPSGGNVRIGISESDFGPDAKLEVIQDDPTKHALLIIKELCDGFQCYDLTTFEIRKTLLGVDGGTSFIVKDTGRVGIKTSNPINSLDVAGNTVIGRDYAGSAIAPFNGLLIEGSTGIGTTSPSGMFHVAGGNATFDDKVGIGTTNPQAPLHISGAGNQYIDITSTDQEGSHTRLMAVTSNGVPESQLQFIGRFGLVEPISGTFKLIVLQNGNVGIGTTLNNNPNNYKLAVNGRIGAKDIWVETTSTTWFGDYVFDKDYKLRTIPALASFINSNGRLPGFVSAKEIAKQGGVSLSEIQLQQQVTIEEYALYLIEIHKRLEKLEKENKEKDKRIEGLEKRLIEK